MLATKSELDSYSPKTSHYKVQMALAVNLHMWNQNTKRDQELFWPNFTHNSEGKMEIEGGGRQLQVYM